MTRRKLSEGALQAITIRRVIEAARPEKVILFGSVARGEMGPHGDVDLLVVKSGADRRQLALTIYRNLRGTPFPIDVIVVTPEETERYGSCPALIIEEPALREGRPVYAA